MCFALLKNICVEHIRIYMYSLFYNCTNERRWTRRLSFNCSVKPLVVFFANYLINVSIFSFTLSILVSWCILRLAERFKMQQALKIRHVKYFVFSRRWHGISDGPSSSPLFETRVAPEEESWGPRRLSVPSSDYGTGVFLPSGESWR